MPIKVACQCGQSFAAPDNLAGRNVKCPKCGQPLQIPAAGAAQPAAPAASRPAAAAPAGGGGLADLLAEEGLAASTAGGGPKCPSCNSPMPPHGFLCTQCGYNTQTGKRLQVADPLANTAKRDAEEMLRKASKQLRETPQEFSADDLGAGANAYIAALIILFTTLVLLGMAGGFFYVFDNYIYDENAGAATAGLMTVLFGCVFGSIGGIWLLVIAFLEDVWKGVFCLICGWYFLYYAITKAGEQKLPFTLYVLGIIMQIAGSVMIGLTGE